MSESRFAGLTSRFVKFCTNYRPFFSVARHNVGAKAQCYLTGLLQKSPVKNMERMEESVESFNYQSQQQFLSDSPWDHQSLISQLSQDVSKVIGSNEASLVIDESSFAKQGKKSVGVARQWNGRLGKVDNCQVGVFAVLTDGKCGSITDFRLYLPKGWTDDKHRCLAAGIPEDEIVFRKKSELAIEMIEAAIERGLQFGWMSADGGYGKEPEFPRAVEDLGLRFIVDVHKDQSIYLEDPELKITPPNGKKGETRGRKPSRLQASSTKINVENYFNGVPDAKWKSYRLRDSTRGKIAVEAAERLVWLWDGQEKKPRRWRVVCLHYKKSGDTKYMLSNADESISLQQILIKKCHRYWVERCFQDGKGSVGMADYQVRGWRAWHHHMSMVAMAMLFVLQERKIYNSDIELLSYTDVIELLNVYIPRKDLTQEEVIANIKRRHRKRKATIEFARKKDRGRKIPGEIVT